MDYKQWFKEEFPQLTRETEWSIGLDAAFYLYSLVREQKPESILEFGSGISTAVLARAASLYGGSVHALEHEIAHQQKTESLCRECGLVNVQIIHAPLVECAYMGVALRIYDPQKIPPGPYPFVFIDGPPGFLPEHAGRRGTMYAAWPLLTETATIILDDAQRPGEQSALDEWQKTLDGTFRVSTVSLERPMARIDLFR